MLKRASTAFIAAWIVMAVGGATAPVAALHSIPPTRMFWDCNDNGVPDDGCARFRLGGSGWTSDKVDRVNAAFWQWRNYTDYTPYTDQTVIGDIFIDRNVSHPDQDCENFQPWSQLPAILAVTCHITTYHPEATPKYYRLHEAEIYFNSVPPTSGAIVWSWWYGGGENPSGTFHFQGVLVHELGHTVRLIDLDCSPGFTMCGDMGASTLASYFARTLAQDDIDAANAIYP
jgi:hypothetical protein